MSNRKFNYSNLKTKRFIYLLQQESVHRQIRTGLLSRVSFGAYLACGPLSSCLSLHGHKDLLFKTSHQVLKKKKEEKSKD